MQWLFNGLLLLNNFLENFLEKNIDIFLESGIIITETRKPIIQKGGNEKNDSRRN